MRVPDVGDTVGKAFGRILSLLLLSVSLAKPDIPQSRKHRRRSQVYMTMGVEQTGKDGFALQVYGEVRRYVSKPTGETRIDSILPSLIITLTPEGR